MSHGVSRRQFIAGVSASAASAMIVPRHVLGRGRQAPSDTLNIAGIGVGGRDLGDGGRARHVHAGTFWEYRAGNIGSGGGHGSHHEQQVDCALRSGPEGRRTVEDIAQAVPGRERVRDIADLHLELS